MRFLETDTILRFLTRDDEAKAEAVLALLKRVERGEERVTVSPMVVFEVVFTLQSYYRVSRADIVDKVSAILDLRGLTLENREIFDEALADYRGTDIPFADAFNARFMKSRGIGEIYTYDRDYDGIEGIRRVSP